MHGFLTPATNLIEGRLTKAIPTAREDRMPFLICRPPRSPRGIFSHVSELRNNRTKTWSHPSMANPADPVGLFHSHASDSIVATKRTYATLMRAMSSWNHWRRTINGLHRPEGLQRPQTLRSRLQRHSFPRLCRYDTLYKTPITHPRTRKVFLYGLGTN